ncbi:oligopeptide ABC transporter (oligopeptide-binding protein), partial [mine drainage metagenome]
MARDGQFVLRTNAHYFLGNSHLTGLKLRVYPTPRAALIALRAGKVDMAPVPPIDASAVATWPKVRLSTTTAPDYLMVGWNFTDTLFSSPMLRQALGYAVNRPAIVASTLAGYGIVAQGML